MIVRPLTRRDVVPLIGGMLAIPLAARAQQAAMPVVGFLRSGTAAGAEHIVGAFRQGLNEGGFIEGRNVAIEFRSAENQLDRLPALIAELLRRPVAVIVANSIAAIVAKTVTTTVPIVFAGGGDPVREGLVTSLNRPGGNVTGANFFLGALGPKRLELLCQVVPKATTVAMLVNPNTLDTETERKDVQAAAQALGQPVIFADVLRAEDIEPTIAALVARGARALLIGTGPFLSSHRERVVALAARHALPASYSWREAAMAGGLMSYGASIPDAYRQLGLYTARILKGEKPGDLPVMRSTRFEFLLNLKTARALGLDIPPTLLALADEVIE